MLPPFAPGTGVPAGDPRIQIRGLSKTFPGTRALVDFDLDIRAGEIHALVGGNGSGKSTLIKILAGIYQGDPGGTVRVGELTVGSSETTPETAREMRIHTVHQDLGVFATMSVAENIALGYRYETNRLGRVRWRSQRRRAQQLIERFEIDAQPSTMLGSLSQAARTQVAIARALQAEDEGHEGLLILDEPTASLPAHEADLLVAMLRKYAREGQSILHVSHRLDEVLALADSVTIVRDGAKVGTYVTSELDQDELIALMVGRQIERVFPAMSPVRAGSSPVLEIRGLSAGPLHDVSLTVRAGEVLGIGGLLGAGRTELLRAIFGDLPRRSGEIVLDGERLRAGAPADAMAAGVAYVPENRSADAAFPDLPVATNISLANMSDYWIAGRMANRKLRGDARTLMGEFLVKAASERVPLATLSGGNQQKVIVARWLRRNPRLLLLDEPTQGVDVGARAEIYGLIRDAVGRGAAAIVVASDFEELAHVSDRVVILRGGRVTTELKPPEISAERLTHAAYQKEVER